MSYNPPIGIPNPSSRFGSFGEINQATPSWPANWLAGTPSEAAGYYYIDKTHPSASDTNVYGYPGHPRVHMPEGNMTGAHMIYVHAGTYGSSDSGSDRFNWYGVFTDTSPLWITGNPSVKPVIQDLTQIGDAGDTSYLVFENFEFSGSSLAHLLIKPNTDGFDLDHILVRNLFMRGTGSLADSTAIIVGLSSSTDTIPNSTINDVVIYNCDIADYGTLSGDTDSGGGIVKGYHTDYTWVLDNIIARVGSDGIAGSHYGNTTTKYSGHYFIGRNLTYGHAENGIDVKAIQIGVISQNEVRGPFVRADGAGIVTHYGASPAIPCSDVQIIFNNIYTCGVGIQCGGSQGNNNATIIGNIFRDIHTSYSPNSIAWAGYCIQMGGSHGTIRIADNTFYDYEGGIWTEDINVTGDAVKIHGNIFNNKNTNLFYEVKVTSGQESKHFCDYNFYPTAPAFFWSNASRDWTYFQGTAGQEANGLKGDPLFVTPGSNFALQSGSPCLDSSVEGPVGDTAYDRFNTIIGQPIEVDYTGSSRPQGLGWDMGAFEFGGTASRKTIVLSGDMAFGNVIIGETLSRVLTVSNTGDTTLTVTSVSYPTGFTGATTGFTVASGGHQDITVTFTPLSAIVYSGNIVVTSDANSGTGTVAASGTGVVGVPPSYPQFRRGETLAQRRSNI